MATGIKGSAGKVPAPGTSDVTKNKGTTKVGNFNKSGRLTGKVGSFSDVPNDAVGPFSQTETKTKKNWV